MTAPWRARSSSTRRSRSGSARNWPRPLSTQLCPGAGHGPDDRRGRMRLLVGRPLGVDSSTLLRILQVRRQSVPLEPACAVLRHVGRGIEQRERHAQQDHAPPQPQRAGEQQEGGEERKEGHHAAGEMPRYGPVADQVVADPVPHRVGEFAPDRVAQPLQGAGSGALLLFGHEAYLFWFEGGPICRQWCHWLSAPAFSAAAFTRVRTPWSSSRSASDTPSFATTAGGTFSASARRALPDSVRSTISCRSSLWLRVRVIRPEASSRLSSGDRVGESSWSAWPISLTVIGASPHSASITRYCGWVSPMGSRIGR